MSEDTPHIHTASCGGVWECSACETKFEAGVADPGPKGEPRCPQCGLWESRPLTELSDDDFVVLTTTKFR